MILLDLLSLALALLAVVLVRLLRGAPPQRETDWEWFERRSGHRFDGAPNEQRFCMRCGRSLADGRLAELARSTCPGPYRESWWLRVARRIAA